MRKKDPNDVVDDFGELVESSLSNCAEKQVSKDAGGRSWCFSTEQPEGRETRGRESQ
jgi:hypothetical protein